ncbi:hypothetical protein IW261DRAFT_1527204 [Armillaria novae-zelandiae]|uniref:Uncharacterized protein n=1 Tax=Armillaria novae-zelandiae TaxID=153914 RepID=A0AA39NBZ6_9AGAR|nr:hypothetical protein IW261DRAFT_1527204 [Armillaria novae-zelandiae]
MQLFRVQTSSQLSSDKSKRAAVAGKLSQQNEPPCENMTSLSVFLTKPTWRFGAYGETCSAVQEINTFRDKYAPYRMVVFNRAFVPRTEAMSTIDHRQVELARLQKVEEDIARRHGRLSTPVIDAVDLFQAVKDTAFITKDPHSLSDLQELDKLLKLRLEIKTGIVPSIPSHRSQLSRVWSFLSNLSARRGVQYLLRSMTKLPK